MNTLHKILELMWKQGISERELCEFAGINKTAVTDWKKGKTKSYLRHIDAIADVLHTTPEYLRDEAEEKQPSLPPMTEEQKRLYSLIDRLPNDRLEEALRYITYLINSENK